MCLFPSNKAVYSVVPFNLAMPKEHDYAIFRDVFLWYVPRNNIYCLQLDCNVPCPLFFYVLLPMVDGVESNEHTANLHLHSYVGEFTALGDVLHPFATLDESAIFRCVP